MSTTLTYGFVKPATGDTGTSFFTALEGNIQKLNDHTHNGTNSSKLTSAATTAVTQAILSAAWVDQGGGIYRQTVTITATITGNGGTYDNKAIQFRNTSTGAILYLNTAKVSSTSYYLYVTDNTLDVTAVYT